MRPRPRPPPPTHRLLRPNRKTNGAEILRRSNHFRKLGSETPWPGKTDNGTSVMDKLQPLIQNRFWILAGLVLPLAMYGYYSANGSLKAATATRVGELDKVKSGISSGREPNEDYAKKLAHINAYYEVAVNQAIVDLWNHQRKLMVWPPTVAANVPAQFQGEFDLNTRFTYKGLYQDLIEELRRRVEPVAPMTQQNSVTWKQKVMLMGDVPQASFGSLGITSQEMWDAQIDIWLTRLLLDAVVKTNEDKDSVTEAIVRRIDRLELWGGDGQAVLSGGGSGGGMSFGGDSMDMTPPGYGPTGGSGGGAKVSSSVTFNPAQEFGAGGGGAASAGSMTMNVDDMAPSGGGAASGATVLRYIAESETSPFLERGFYMSVIIMQKKVPDFIVELVNSEWPIRIQRFHIGTNPYRMEKSIGTRGPLGGGYGPGGPMDSEMTEGYDMPLGGLGGRGEGRGTQAGNTKNPYATGLPEFATAAMNHPELVQLDLAGVITMYREPKDAIEALAAARQQEAAAETSAATAPSATSAPSGTNVTEEAAAETQPADPGPAAPPAAEGTTEPTTEGSPDSVPEPTTPQNSTDTPDQNDPPSSS